CGRVGEIPPPGRPGGGARPDRRLGRAACACWGGGAGAPKGAPPPGAFLPPPPKKPAPSRNRHEQQNGCGDGIIAVAVPQLLELFPPDFLVDFVKDVGHERPRPIPRSHAPTVAMAD